MSDPYENGKLSQEEKEKIIAVCEKIIKTYPLMEGRYCSCCRHSCGHDSDCEVRIADGLLWDISEGIL